MGEGYSDLLGLLHVLLRSPAFLGRRGALLCVTLGSSGVNTREPGKGARFQVAREPGRGRYVP